ncbi:MAG: UDP-N-acetylmuramoyl-tripeptide--D-alanyl-D-alanine ligase [Burkholderiales bacterium]|nr:UDP-N-acetylmuramoyl-tripeptide--D-alanyl-D-alanine ligase [Burkholderiales bacterium]
MLDLDRAARDIDAGRRGPNVSFHGVTTDSRQVAHGDLFVALRGERFDGHAFVDQALAAGAAAAMVDDARGVITHDAALILVDDTRRALGRLAAAWRARFALPLVAITGSNGKTTVKEMIAAILRAHVGDEAVLATSGNLNNDIGVPLMLLRLRSHHRYAVIEMGMNHLGEIRYLSELSAPTVALVNNAGTAHIGELGSREAIAQAKGEIYEGLDRGVALINADDDFADYWRGLNRARTVVDFGIDRPATVQGRVEGDVLSVSTPGQSYRVRVSLPGLHNLRNALAACAVAHALGLPDQAVVSGLNQVEGAKGRLQVKAGVAGARVIDDTYNANPDSMRAAIAVLVREAAPRILVMGDMGELGADAPRLHEELGEEARRAGIEHLFALGDLSAGAARSFGRQARAFRDLDVLCRELTPLLAPGVTVLVKGSRFMRMERVVQRLLDGPDHDREGH